MHHTTLLALSLSLLTHSHAQQILSGFSFGQDGKINIGANHDIVSGYTISGRDYTPQVFSDRIQLTPPAPGNRRGALYANEPLPHDTWEAMLSFRANGPERGTGNLHLWLTSRSNQPGSDLSQGSIYGVDRFDGLAIVIDQYAGRGGSLRAFLNDGSSWRGANVDSFAFAHCDFPYRNLGRFSDVRILQSASGLEVTIDGNQCFRADQVALPRDYYLSLSAASAETPDSFEISRFVVLSQPAGFSQPGAELNKPPPEQLQQPIDVGGTTTGGGDAQNPQRQRQFMPGRTGNIPGQDIADVLNRIQAAQNVINNVYTHLLALESRQEEWHTKSLADVSLSKSSSSSSAEVGAAFTRQSQQLDALERRLTMIETKVDAIRRDIEGKDYRESLAGLSESLRETREGLVGAVSRNAPRMGFFVFVVVAVQIMLAGAYIVYKARRANSPKKLL